MFKKGWGSDESPAIKIMSWNVRGVGDYKERQLIRETIAKACPDIVVLQETKKEDMSIRLV